MYYLHGGAGTLEALRTPLVVNRATFDRARGQLAFQPMADRIDPARRAVWFRTHKELYVPYWSLPEYRKRECADPMATRSDLLYQPFWMTNKSRARLIQRPLLQLRPRSQVLAHLGTDEFDGLGKGFKPFKALKRAVTFTPTSFQPKKLFGALGSLVGTTATFGLGPIIAPKVFSANSKTMKSLGMAATAVAVVAGGVVFGPAIVASIGPTLSSAAGLAGKAVTGMTGFFKAFNALSPGARQAQAGQLTPQQIADIEAGRAQLTEQGVVYQQPAPPGGSYELSPQLPAPIGPEGQPVAEAGMFGGMSPMTIGLLIGAPLVFTLLTREKR